MNDTDKPAPRAALLANAVWNTHRGYTSEGQRIAARILEDGRVAFCDIDRHVWGITQSSCCGGDGDPEASAGKLEAFVMQAYDASAYIGWEPGIEAIFKGLRLAALDAPRLDTRRAGC